MTGSNPAETYERFMVPFRFRPWAQELLDRAALEDGARILDIACGTGIVAREAARRLRAGKVSGLDMNPAMIDVAQRHARAEGLDIDWHVGVAEELPFQDDSFDLVTIQQGLQFFPDIPAALAEIRRVLRPGALFALSIWAPADRQGINHAFAVSVERVTGAASMHSPYGRFDHDQLRTLLTGAGFAVDSIEEVDIELRHTPAQTFVPLLLEGVSAGVPAMHGRGETERAQLARSIELDMQEALCAATIGETIVTRSTSNIVRSRPL